MDDEEMLYKEKCLAIIKACMEVHNYFGNGFLESVYQEAFEDEFELQNIPSIREYPLQIIYKNKLLEKEYISDSICYNKIIVELKAVTELSSRHTQSDAESFESDRFSTRPFDQFQQV
jgi:GxxExxY protein